MWLGLKALTKMPSSVAFIYDTLFDSIVLGLSALLLLAGRIGNRNRFVTFLLAVIILAAWFSIHLAGFGFSNDTISIAVAFAAIASIMLLSVVLSGWSCRKYYTPLSFILWLAVWTLTLTVVSMLILFLLAMYLQNVPLKLSNLLQMLIPSMISAVVIYIIELPFVILAAKSSFFRQHFHECFRLRGMLPAVPQAGGTGPDNVIFKGAGEKDTDGDDKDKIPNEWRK